MYVQQKSYHNLISDLYGSGGRQINSDTFTFAADSSPQQSGDVYLSLIMVQGELQPEIAELTLSSYRFRPATWKESNPSPMPLASAQLLLSCRAQLVPLRSRALSLIKVLGADAFLTNACLNLFLHARETSSLVFIPGQARGEQLIHIPEPLLQKSRSTQYWLFCLGNAKQLQQFHWSCTLLYQLRV